MDEEECPEGVDQELAVLAIGAAIAAGAYIVYRDITLRFPGRRRGHGGFSPVLDLVASLG